jgi:hypothetical protein
VVSGIAVLDRRSDLGKPAKVVKQRIRHRDVAAEVPVLVPAGQAVRQRQCRTEHAAELVDEAALPQKPYGAD